MAYIDPNDIYAVHSDTWRDYWDAECSVFQATKQLIQSCIALPETEIQSTLASIYAWTNPKWAFILPVLVCQGREGSGKSEIAKIAKHLREGMILGQNSTFASIRNWLNSAKYLQMEDSEEFDKTYEKDGALLVLDNAYVDTFNDKDLLSLFLSGYNKADDSIQIANPGTGKNFEFRTFSSRIISTVEPLYSSQELRELNRRSIYLFHKRFEDLSEQEQNDFNLDERLEVDSVNWKGFSDVYYDFWSDPNNCVNYAIHRRSLSKKPKGLSSVDWQISKDLITTGLLTGAFQSKDQGFRFFEDYFAFMRGRFTDVSSLETVLSEFVAPWAQSTKKIQNSIINRHIESLMEKKALLEKPRAKQIEAVMLRLGWESEGTQWVMK